MDDIISPATRKAFDHSYVWNGGTLSNILNDFNNAGIDRVESARPDKVGERQHLLNQYYTSVVWSSEKDCQKVLLAYASHLRYLKQRSLEEEAHSLLRRLKLDKMRSSAKSVFDVIDTILGSHTKALEDAISIVETSFGQAWEHLTQALEHLRTLPLQNARSRKDGLRDCLSAMEALLKAATGMNDIRDATDALRKDERWGNDIIVKDGLSIWSLIHKLYADVRHGQASASDLSEHECLYWVDRITVFVSFIAKRAEVLLANKEEL